MEHVLPSTSSAARRWQRQQDVLAVFWDRKISPWFTRTFIRIGMTPNQITVLWGLISVGNSFTVYRAITGEYWLVPVVWAIYVVASVFDCSDGEVARATNRVNPVAGKLLDGICHRATEYSLTGAFGAGAWTLTGSPWVLPITVALLAGDAMESYVYERRISILRVQQRVTGALQHAPDALYAWGTRWTSLPWRQKLTTFSGTVHYKSIYAVIAIAYVSPFALVIGLGALGLYKHWKWMRLLSRTLAQSERAETAAAGVAS
jgi:phosphatidylglycerophosphate synthase